MAEVIYQRTIQRPFEISGVGIHTGNKSFVTVLPASPNHGIVFVKDGVSIPASFENVTDTRRCTTLGRDRVSISTVEHILSACYGLGVDNLSVNIREGGEMPILDGSSRGFAEKIMEVGIESQEAPRRVLQIKQVVSLRRDESLIVGMPDNHFSITMMVDYNHPVVGPQYIQYIDGEDDYMEKLSSARTFAFKEEIEHLLEKNLAMGGSLDNALVIEKDGYMNTPRFPDEVVRHKCLDLLGDLSLTGSRIMGHIFAYKSSHSLNTAFAGMLVV